MNDSDFMSFALAEAEKAFNEGEIPIGAIITFHDSVIASCHNLCERDKDPTAHAEILAIQNASKVLGNWRLTGCTLYVTIEPCPMCAGAVMNARMDRIVYGAPDFQSGGIDSNFYITRKILNHTVSVTKGVQKDACQKLLSDFFAKKRLCL